jgi:polyisoprenoid-binding protein YceI
VTRAGSSPLPRRTIAALTAVAAALAPVAAHAQPQGYTFDPTHSFVTFEVLHFDTSTIRGRFGPVQGRLLLDRSARTGHVGLEIDLASVSTGVPLLDKRLRGSEMLAVDANPKAYFVAKGFSFDDQGRVTEARGEFTLRGQSRPLTLTAQRYRCYTSPLFGREVCGGDFDAEIDRSEFGITTGLPFVADRVRLRVQVEAVRDP